MKIVVTNQKKRVGDWVAEKIGCHPDWGPYEAIGIESDGEIVCGVVVDDYIDAVRCNIHFAVKDKSSINREFVRVVFSYVFEQLGCRIVLNTVDSENTDSLNITSRFGFTEKCRIEGGSPEGDLVVFVLKREDCRWINIAR